MIVHIDSDNPKPLEQKVQELILKKLYIKVDDEKIFIDKEDFIRLILKDVMAIAKADFDIDQALLIALEEQVQYQSIPETKRNELVEAAIEFQVEIEAYQFYLDGLEDELDEDEIYMEVLLILNSEFELLENKLHQLIMDSIGSKISEANARAMNSDILPLLENYANYVKIIASHDSISEAAEELYLKNRSINKGLIQHELEKFAPALQDEINAYKMALSMNDQNAEFPMILAMVKQLLNLED